MKTNITILLLLISTYTIAANDQVPIDREIVYLRVYENEVLVHFTPEFQNTQNCPETSKSMAVIDLANEKGKSMYAAILSAAAAKKKVGFGLGLCKNSPLIYRVDVAY